MARKTSVRVSSQDPTNEPGKEVFPLSGFDHILPRIYTPITLTFKLQDDVDRQVVIDNLCSGLQSTLSQYRSLRGTLESDESSGQLWIRKERYSTVEFITNWLDGPEDGFTSYEVLEKMGFPTSEIDGNTVLPLSVTRKQPMAPPSEGGNDDNPVLVVQANFIRGGLILAIAIHHNCSDGSGANGFLCQWAENTRGVYAGKPPVPIDPLVLDRSPLDSQARADCSSADEIDEKLFALSVVKKSCLTELKDIPTPPEDFKMPSLSPVVFHFSTSGLAQLKEDAKLPSQAFISSYNALTAILWRCMTRARLPLFNPELSATTRFGHAVGIRGALDPPLPASYLGNALVFPAPSIEIGALLSDGGLPQAASAIRTSIQEATSPAAVKAIADWLSSVQNKAATFLNSFMGIDVAATSWGQMTSYQEHDFGFGLPKALRWPKTMMDGYIFIYPRRPKDDPEEGIELCVYLETSCMERLLADEELAQYAHPRGLS